MILGIEVFGYNIEQSLPLIGISVWNIIVFLMVLAIGIILAIIVGRIVKLSLLKSKASYILAEFVSRIVRMIIYIFVIFTAIGFLGLGPYMVAVMASVAIVLGFVLGFALSDTLGNIASGIMIAITKPFQAGDVVKIKGEIGTIKSVGISVTEMDTPDNKHIIVPNKLVYGDTIINFTRNPVRRVDMQFGVGYDADLDKVIKVTMDVINSNPKVIKDPVPQVAVNEWEDSAVMFVVRPWCKTEDYWDVYFGLKKALKEAYDANGITIPFPQMDIHLQKE
jgi:small conductance mechanosensitive channel